MESRPEQHQVGRNHAAIALADDQHANITVQKKKRQSKRVEGLKVCSRDGKRTQKLAISRCLHKPRGLTLAFSYVNVENTFAASHSRNISESVLQANEYLCQRADRECTVFPPLGLKSLRFELRRRKGVRH